jgi:aspartate-semialdehyde dehydrogenase
MNRMLNVAVFGATGAVGVEIYKPLIGEISPFVN